MTNNIELEGRLVRLQKEAADSLSDIFLTDTQVKWLAEELSNYIDSRVQKAYRKGYNDNSRDCYCDSPGATEGVLPHSHLFDDGESHNIRPDIESLKANKGSK